MKQQPERRGGEASAQSQQDELRQCSQILARLGPEECSLLTQVPNLRVERNRLEGARAVYHPLEHKSGGVPDVVLKRMASIDGELPRLEARLREITPRIRDAQTKRQAILGDLLVSARHRVQAALDDAMDKVSLSRDAFLAEKEKLHSLQAKLHSAKEDVRRLENTPLLMLNKARAMALLETGEIPPAQISPEAGEELREARTKVSIIKAAIAMQIAATETAKSVFSGEMNVAIKKYREDIVRRIASGYSEAANAALEAALLLDTSRDAGVSMGYFSFPAVRPAMRDENNVFGSWLDECRRAGYDV